MGFTIKAKTRILGLAAAGLMSMMLAAPALADSPGTATTTINGGALAASLSNSDLTDPTYSHSTATTATGSFTLTVDDSRGVGTGWNVTIVSGNFTSGGNSIAATNFTLATIADPAQTAGQARSATANEGPNKVTPGTMTLDTAREVIDAGANFGQGTYTQALGVSLNVPALTKAGNYSATVTVTSTNAP